MITQKTGGALGRLLLARTQTTRRAAMPETFEMPCPRCGGALTINPLDFTAGGVIVCGGCGQSVPLVSDDLIEAAKNLQAAAERCTYLECPKCKSEVERSTVEIHRGLEFRCHVCGHRFIGDERMLRDGNGESLADTTKKLPN